MNRRGFLKFLVAAPVAAPLAAQSMAPVSAAVSGWQLLTPLHVSGLDINWGRSRLDFSWLDLYETKLDRDARLFNEGLRAVDCATDDAARAGSIIEKVVDKASEVIVEHLDRAIELVAPTELRADRDLNATHPDRLAHQPRDAAGTSGASS